MLNKQGAKLLTLAKELVERLPTPVRAASLKAEQPEANNRTRGSETLWKKKVYDLQSAEESRHMDDRVEQSGLNSSQVLATLFDLEMKGWCGPSTGSNAVRCCYSSTYGANHGPRMGHLKPESIPKADGSI